MPIDIKKHKELGLCIRCTTKAKEGFVSCERHIIKYRKVKQSLKENGLCYDCCKPAEYGFTRCRACLDIQSDYTTEEKKKRIKEGRCRDCGRILTEDDFVMRSGKVTCAKCCDKLFRWT